MISEPLGLPERTLIVAFFISLAGLVIAVVASWIYDIQPEVGVVKTEKADSVTTEVISKASSSWKIASYISFVVIVGLIVLNIIPRSGKKEVLDRSIAVLPFKYLSDEPDKQYLADGAMDEILLNLSKIEDLRVLARTSVEQYRVTDKTATEICQELDVAYVLEGSFLKDGDQVRLIVQLIESGREGHAWAKKYDRNWQDIFTVQSEVAQAIAGELQVVITPEEKKLIEKIPTANLTAYDFYSRGLNEYNHFLLERENRLVLDKAEESYKNALKYDSTFALAYTGLAQVYWDRYFAQTYFSEEFLDSVLILVDIALSYDNQLSEAYTIKGGYYNQIGQPELALEEYDKAIKLNPNDWMAYWQKARFYTRDDLVKAIDNALRAASINRGPRLPEILGTVGHNFHNAGFFDKSIQYAQEILELNNDSAQYYLALSIIEAHTDNRQRALDNVLKAYKFDTTDENAIFRVAETLVGFDQYEALKYFNNWIEKIEALGGIDVNNLHRIGYLYFKTGNQEMSDYYFDMQEEYCLRSIDLNRPYARRRLYAYYDLATVYAFRGEKDKAYENLRIFNRNKRMPLWVVDAIKISDPLFDSIRDEAEFQQIVNDIEAKFQAEHERVRQWLEENDML